MALTRSFALTVLSATVACGGGSTTSTAPSLPSPPSPTTFSLSGTVREWPTARPVAGATVSVVEGPNAGSAAVTNAAGNYRLGGLEQGEFTVVVSAPDRFPQMITGSLTSNREIDFELRHRGAAYQLTGRVIDEDGMPLADAAVAFDLVSPDNALRFAQPEAEKKRRTRQDSTESVLLPCRRAIQDRLPSRGRTRTVTKPTTGGSEERRTPPTY